MKAHYIKELQDVIRRVHGAEATHVESVPVREAFQGKTIWEGIVEVFEQRAIRQRSEPTHGRTIRMTLRTRSDMLRYSTSIRSSQHKMRQGPAIVQEFRNLGTAEEE